MSFIDIKKKIKEISADQYTDVQISLMVQKIMDMAPEIRVELEKYLSNQKYRDIRSSGYSITKLEKEFGLNKILAFIALDLIKKDLSKTIKLLQDHQDFII